MNIKFIKGHDGPEIEEGEVEVVLEQLQDVVVSIFPLTVLQGEAHTAHDREPTAPIEENVTQLKVPLHKSSLCGEETKEKQKSKRDAHFLSFTFIQDRYQHVSSLPPNVEAAVYLPGHERITLECGEGTKASGEAKPADLH